MQEEIIKSDHTLVRQLQRKQLMILASGSLRIQAILTDL